MLPHHAEGEISKLQQARCYGVLMRLPMLLWSAFLGLVIWSGLRALHGQDRPGFPVFVCPLNIAMRLSVIADLIVIAATVLARMRPAGKARGAEPRISAFVGTLMFTVWCYFHAAS